MMKIWIGTLIVLVKLITSSTGTDDSHLKAEVIKDFIRSLTQPDHRTHLHASDISYLPQDTSADITDTDRNPRILGPLIYVAPDSSYNKSKREKRETDDYDYSKSYRDFVRQNFGENDAQAYAGEDENLNDNDEYERIKEISERQSEESKKNPEYCKVFEKDGKECTVCKNPKTKAHSESCSYSSNPKPKKYAYKRERNYNSKDDEHDDNEKHSDDEESPRKTGRKSSKRRGKKSRKTSGRNSSKQPQRMKSKSKSSQKNNSRRRKSVHKEIDEHYSYPLNTANQPDQPETLDVLNDFRNRDWSNCTMRNNKGYICYYCKDDTGANHEECMYDSETSPQEATLMN